MNTLSIYGGLIESKVPNMLLWFHVDGMGIFQGACHKTIIKIWEVHTRLLTKINCMVDKTNLVVQTHYFACVSIPRKFIQFFYFIFKKFLKHH
jgi:hypothetical protein